MESKETGNRVYLPLLGHNSEATAFVVEDYPYGFTLRCKIRYWIESTKHGFRFCSQTTNPKVSGERWNKPKKSTYCLVAMGMFQVCAPGAEDDGHVSHAGCSGYDSLTNILAWKEKFQHCLSAEARLSLEMFLKAKRCFQEKLDSGEIYWTVNGKRV